MIDLGTGNNNKINWVFSDKQELIDIIEVVYRGGRKGRGLVVSPKDCACPSSLLIAQPLMPPSHRRQHQI
jgi:Mitosis protein DIM1